MDQVEADIKKLSKNYIFVDTTAPSTFMWTAGEDALCWATQAR